jgi:hypothetical protein
MSVLSIQEFLGKPAAVLASDGQRLADFLTERAQRGEAVTLSFVGLRHVTTAFLHAAIGTVLLHYPSFATYLHVQGFEAATVEWKVNEVRRMALDTEYRQQMQQAWAEEMA